MDYRDLLRQGILSTAKYLGADPYDLATVMSYETAGTFDPTKRGPVTQYGQHEGLIQFGVPQQQEYGYDRSDPIGSQLGPDGAVAKYLLDRGYQPGMGLLDMYSIINAGAPGRYNASDANNGGAPGTVADKVRDQMAGHRAKAVALLGGEGDDLITGGADQGDPLRSGGPAPRGPLPPIQGAPERETFNVPGLLGRILGVGDRQMPEVMEEPEPRWLERKTKGIVTPDVWDQLMANMAGLSLNPNQAVIQGAQQRIASRRDDAAIRREQQEALRQEENAQLGRNQTAEWLMAQGREDLASAMLSGALEPGQAVAAAMAPPVDDRPEMVKLYEYARQQGSQQTFDEFMRPDGDGTALLQSIDGLMERGGMTFEEALDAVTNAGTSKPGYMGSIPQDYQLIEEVGPDGNKVWRMEPIPGSPTEQEIIETSKLEREKAEGRSYAADNVISAISDVRAKVGDGGLPVTGQAGSWLSNIGGTDAHDIRELLDPILSNTAFDRLQRMREESKTGGALGNVSNVELDLLKNSIRSLKQSQSQEQFLDALRVVEEHYMRILRKAAAYDNAAEFGFDYVFDDGPLPTASTNPNDPGRNNDYQPNSWRIVE